MRPTADVHVASANAHIAERLTALIAGSRLRRAFTGSDADCALVDITTGLSNLRDEVSARPEVPTIAIHDHADDGVCADALRTGAYDCRHLIDLTPEGLEAAVERTEALRQGHLAVHDEAAALLPRLRLMQELFATISSTDLTRDQQIQRILEAGVDLFEMSAGAVSRIAGANAVTDHVHAPTGDLAVGESRPLETTFSDLAVRAHGPIAIEDVQRSRWTRHGSATSGRLLPRRAREARRRGHGHPRLRERRSPRHPLLGHRPRLRRHPG